MAEENCSCSCSGDSTASFLVFPCAGGSNVGQISNAAALELDRTGKARLYCLAGVAAHIDGMVASAQGARAIAIDGCNTACARKALEHAGVQVERAIIITDLGIAKNHVFSWSQAEIEQTLSAVGV
jgi:uncharacterized metal-binding protein